MSIVNKRDEWRFKELGTQGTDNPIVVLVLYLPYALMPTTSRLFITEYNRKDKTLFGYSYFGDDDPDTGWNELLIDEIEKHRTWENISYERDNSFKEKRFIDAYWEYLGKAFQESLPRRA